MDKAVWMSWYDLPTQGREEYLQWLHGDYIPRLLKKPGVKWAGHYASAKVPPAPRLTHVKDQPTGNDFMLLLGGENAHTFTKGPGYYMHPEKKLRPKLEPELSDRDHGMLAMRANERVTIMIEENRVDGPEAANREGPMVPGASLQLGNFCANSVAAEDELLSWFGDWRLDALKNLPGIIGARTLVGTVGWARHGCMYEFISEAARVENYPKIRDLYPDAAHWTERFTRNLIHAVGSPMVANRIWPPVR